MMTRASLLTLLILASPWPTMPSAHADGASRGHVLAPKFRETCQRKLDALIETQLDQAEARGSSCLAEVIYDPRRASAFKTPIVQTCTDRMVAHARGEGDESDGATLKQAFDDAYGVIFRSSCLDREVREFPAHAPGSKSVSNASY